jgi:toxin FitB
MILLDTNVVSEMMRAQPAAEVVSWMAGQPASGLYVSSITQAEILRGLLLMPRGRRQRSLEKAAAGMFDEDFVDRVLPFDSAAAVAYAQITADRRRAGRPIAVFDAQIAGVARATGATLATRNTADFARCGIELINPWA